MFACHLIPVTQRKLTCTEWLVLHLSWLHGNHAARTCHLSQDFASLLSSLARNVINFYLRFIAFAAGNRTIASSYWGSSEQYAVKKLDYNSLRGSHIPWTLGTPWMLLDIEVNLNWVKQHPTSAVCLHWIILFYRLREGTRNKKTQRIE